MCRVHVCVCIVCVDTHTYIHTYMKKLKGKQVDKMSSHGGFSAISSLASWLIIISSNINSTKLRIKSSKSGTKTISQGTLCPGSTKYLDLPFFSFFFLSLKLLRVFIYGRALEEEMEGTSEEAFRNIAIIYISLDIAIRKSK